jgi:hypothetical protein
MKTHATPFAPGGQKKLFPEQIQDTYQLKGKLHEPTVCPVCGAVYHTGRWQWIARPPQADEVRCTACHRIADGVPAGYLTIEGDFALQHRDELLKLLCHHVERALAEHPMERIIAIEDDGGRTTVTTTGVHLARDLGVALKSAFQGSLELHYGKDENLLRAHWQR